MPSQATRVSLWGFVNAYLVPQDDGLTLIDTTLAQGAGRILAAADRLGAPITRIVLTHAHGDHIGGLDKLKQSLPDAEVLISARDARLLAGDKTPDPDEPQRKLRGDYKGARTKPTGMLVEGEHVGSLRVIASPGHTPGHVSLLDERDQTIFCGDVYTTLGGVATSARGKPLFPLAAMATWDKQIELDSAGRLRALDPAYLAPGHGRIVASPLAAMDAAIARGA
ncbi:MAG TPA: MBL fold metallo-hydrolase [Solirubrobacteraceae bacterium]|jgi:glyoxylase-like metal-dependent hydrolase (beta-lactamase superfamily II)|nr:MBL fold metallo-hydrolase [Solirubrobacteraceae bacterium]